MKVEKDVPLEQGLGARQKDLIDLQIGESFLIKNTKSWQSYYLAAQTIGMRVSISKTDEGMRLWRVE